MFLVLFYFYLFILFDFWRKLVEVDYAIAIVGALRNKFQATMRFFSFSPRSIPKLALFYDSKGILIFYTFVYRVVMV